MSSKQSIKVFAPASVSNVGSGYDIMGFAIEQPGDIIEVFLNDSGKISIENCSDSNIPVDSSNVVFPAIKKMLLEAGNKRGVHLRFISKINPGSGIGSSAASSSGAVFAVNELMGLPFTRIDLVRFAMEGEKLVSGEAHADNVAPCILGGFTLVRSYNPLDIIQVPYPANLICTVVQPEISIRTADSREVVKKDISVKDAVIQTGNASALIVGLMSGDLDLVGRSVHDVIAEPYRKTLIPGYIEAKKSVMDSGAIAVNISGSGPSIFAFNKNKAEAIKTGKIISSVFTSLGINSDTYISPISDIGVREIS
jgi:homoserine kinase